MDIPRDRGGERREAGDSYAWQQARPFRHCGQGSQAAVGMLDVDVKLRRLDVEWYLGHSPGSRQAEGGLVECGVKHGAGNPGRRHSPARAHPQKTRMDRTR